MEFRLGIPEEESSDCYRRTFPTRSTSYSMGSFDATVRRRDTAGEMSLAICIMRANIVNLGLNSEGILVLARHTNNASAILLPGVTVV